MIYTLNLNDHESFAFSTRERLYEYIEIVDRALELAHLGYLTKTERGVMTLVTEPLRPGTRREVEFLSMQVKLMENHGKMRALQMGDLGNARTWYVFNATAGHEGMWQEVAHEGWWTYAETGDKNCQLAPCHDPECAYETLGACNCGHDARRKVGFGDVVPKPDEKGFVALPPVKPTDPRSILRAVSALHKAIVFANGLEGDPFAVDTMTMLRSLMKAYGVSSDDPRHPSEFSRHPSEFPTGKPEGGPFFHGSTGVWKALVQLHEEMLEAWEDDETFEIDKDSITHKNIERAIKLHAALSLDDAAVPESFETVKMGEVRYEGENFPFDRVVDVYLNGTHIASQPRYWTNEVVETARSAGLSVLLQGTREKEFYKPELRITTMPVQPSSLNDLRGLLPEDGRKTATRMWVVQHHHWLAKLEERVARLEDPSHEERMSISGQRPPHDEQYALFVDGERVKDQDGHVVRFNLLSFEEEFTDLAREAAIRERLRDMLRDGVPYAWNGLSLATLPVSDLRIVHTDPGSDGQIRITLSDEEAYDVYVNGELVKGENGGHLRIYLKEGEYESDSDRETNLLAELDRAVTGKKGYDFKRFGLTEESLAGAKLHVFARPVGHLGRVDVVLTEDVVIQFGGKYVAGINVPEGTSEPKTLLLAKEYVNEILLGGGTQHTARAGLTPDDAERLWANKEGNSIVLRRAPNKEAAEANAETVQQMAATEEAIQKPPVDRNLLVGDVNRVPQWDKEASQAMKIAAEPAPVPKGTDQPFMAMLGEDEMYKEGAQGKVWMRVAESPVPLSFFLADAEDTWDDIIKAARDVLGVWLQVDPKASDEQVPTIDGAFWVRRYDLTEKALEASELVPQMGDLGVTVVIKRPKR